MYSTVTFLYKKELPLSKKATPRLIGATNLSSTLSRKLVSFRGT